MSETENPAFLVGHADWLADGAAIARVREAVFIREQGVPEALEWETIDALCEWFAAWLDGGIVGIARLAPDHRIGRMAVLPEWRGRGIGSALLEAVLDRAEEKGLRQVTLHAQSHAVPFYGRFGFRPVGDEFLEADIPHRLMTRKIEAPE
ncbi:MAG: GNAT family N-acetyltransferase [Thiobacillaceae bacterium]|nr:GNAT family N-acetyltransferase [Thiobacillaceae bacterium]